MYSIGVDIGSFSIKVAKVRSLPKGYEVVSLSEYPLPQDPNKDPQLDIIEALRDIYKRYWEEKTIVVGGAHQYNVSVRSKSFPFRERHKILKSLPFELEDEIPLSIENSVFDAKLSFYRGSMAHILAVACPKTHVQDILKRFNDGGLLPDIVSVCSMGAANLFEEWRESPWEYPDAQAIPALTPVDVVVDLGHKTSTVAVIKDGYLLDVRLIEWGGKDLAEVIAHRYSMHYLEALKEVRRKAFILTNNEGATKDQIALSEVVKSSVDVFAQKLRLVLLDLQSMHQVEFRQAVMTGGLAQLRNLGAYLTQKVEVATNRLGSLDMLPGIDFAGSPNNEIANITAIGLALEGLKRPKNPPLNLLKGDFAKQNQTLQNLWLNWGATAKFIGICFCIVLIWGAIRTSFTESNKLESYDALRSSSKTILNAKRFSENDVKKYIKEQEIMAKLKETIEGLQSINSALDLLKSISEVAPTGTSSGLNVRNFKVSKDVVSLSGEANSAESVTRLEKALQSVAAEGKLQNLTPPQGQKPGYKSFSYQFRMNRGIK